MTDFAAWLATGDEPLGDEIALSQARLIARQPATIAVTQREGGGNLPGAQTVRIDPLQNPERYVGDAAGQSDQWVLVLGYKNHPTQADTDLKPGDRFTHDGAHYRVHQVQLARTYQFEAYCRAVW